MPNEKPNDGLGVYLIDHYAGGTGALELLETMSKTHAEDALGAFFTQLYADVKSDHEKLAEIMRALGFEPSGVRDAGAWVAEKFSRAKVALSKGDAQLRLLQALEALYIGITGKRLLWRAMMRASNATARLPGTDFAALENRALDQLERVERERLKAAETEFRAT